jgi:putative transcriptional regulator
MIKCHLSKIMGEKKLKISDLATATNINRGTITRLYKETFTRVEIEVIEQLCKFFNCGVGDLFEYIGDDN